MDVSLRRNMRGEDYLAPRSSNLNVKTLVTAGIAYAATFQGNR